MPQYALIVFRISSDLFEDNYSTKRFRYHIEPKIVAQSRDKLCPRDGREGTAFVDVAPDPHAGLATVMLSYGWGYKVWRRLKR